MMIKLLEYHSRLNFRCFVRNISIVIGFSRLVDSDVMIQSELSASDCLEGLEGLVCELCWKIVPQKANSADYNG